MSSMNGRSELALLGVVLLFLGAGTCILSALGFIDQNMVDLPLGPIEDDAAGTTSRGWPGPVLGLAVALVGVVLMAVGGSHPRRNKGENRPTENDEAPR